MARSAATTAPVAADAPKKKGKGKLFVILGAVALLGAGTAAGLFAAGFGLVPGGQGEAKVEPDVPKLVAKPTGGYETIYAPIEAEFTANLRGSTRFIQLRIGVATHYDQRVIDRLAKHDLPIRSAVLSILSDQTEEDMSTTAGKERLQGLLKTAINETLVAKEGFGGIDAVYFTAFIMQ